MPPPPPSRPRATGRVTLADVAALAGVSPITVSRALRGERTVDPVLAEHTQADMQDALRLGFGAKMCIHPAQLAGVRRALTPLPAEIDWAREVVTAWDAAHASNGPTGALQVQGKMVDKPVYLRAQRILNLQQFSQAAA